MSQWILRECSLACSVCCSFKGVLGLRFLTVISFPALVSVFTFFNRRFKVPAGFECALPCPRQQSKNVSRGAAWSEIGRLVFSHISYDCVISQVSRLPCCNAPVHVCLCLDADNHQPGHIPPAVRCVPALQRHSHQKGLCGDPDA